MRINVYVSDRTLEAARSRHPSLNASRVFQEALASLTECAHEVLGCARCGSELGREHLERQAAERLFAASVEALEQLMWKGGTVEGALRVFFDVSRKLNVRLAFTRQLPRPTRTERERVRELEEAV